MSIKKFRIRSKKLFLTYSQIKDLQNIKELVLEKLKLKFLKLKNESNFNYIISCEKHEDSGIHVHVYLEFSTTIDIIKSDFLDLEIDDKNYHGNYQSGKKKWSLINYVIKDNNYITNMKLPIHNGVILKPEEHLYEIVKKEGFLKSKEILYLNYPEIAVKKGTLIEKNLYKIYEFFQSEIRDLKKKKNIKSINDFKIPKELIEWKNNNFKKTLVLHGPSGTGKTELAKAFLNHCNLNYLFTRCLDGLREYDKDLHQAILLDDINGEALTREVIIHLTDTDNESQIKVIYKVVNISSDVVRIITTNHLEHFTRNLKEIERRIIPVSIDKIVYNIQINNYNTINNFT